MVLNSTFAPQVAWASILRRIVQHQTEIADMIIENLNWFDITYQRKICSSRSRGDVEWGSISRRSMMPMVASPPCWRHFRHRTQIQSSPRQKHRKQACLPSFCWDVKNRYVLSSFSSSFCSSGTICSTFHGLWASRPNWIGRAGLRRDLQIQLLSRNCRLSKQELTESTANITWRQPGQYSQQLSRWILGFRHNTRRNL